MSLKTVARAEIQRLEVLSVDGVADPSVPVDISEAELLRVYRVMNEIRAFDDRAVKLQRTGRLGTYPAILGQEASQCIPALCLRPSDWMVPTYRGGGAYHARGMKPRYALLYWAGDDRGVHYPEGSRDMIFSIPVGTHLTQAAGLAWAEKLQKRDGVCLTYVGDGTTSKGDLHEALTFAGQFSLPLIVVVENNQWAISVPRSKQAASETLAQKAWGYGVHGLQVDGNDALAVWKGATEAIARARRGAGPTLLECETYRIGNHTTADDATRYRDSAEVEAWRKKDPVARLRLYLDKKGLWDASKEEKLQAEIQAMIQAEVEAYESFPAPSPLDMFTENYAQAPWHVIEQRAELETLLQEKKEHDPVFVLPPAEGRFP